MKFLVALSLAWALPLAAQKPRLELADSVKQGAAPLRAPAARAGADAPAPRDTARVVRRIGNTAFVRNQTLLGVFLYGPSFASTVTNSTVSGTAAYLVMAGGSFFAAAELSRDLTITDAMQHLATRAPIIGAAVGGAMQYAITGKHEYAPGIFFGSILGTTGALTLGQRLTTGAAVASTYGAYATSAVVTSAMFALDTTSGHARARAGVFAASALAGLQLGAMYGAYSKYNVTAGDLSALTTAGLIGTFAAGAAVANGDPGQKTVTMTLLGGFVAGTLAGDRLLVRRYDHTEGEGRLITVAGVAGGLMGAGVATLAGAGERFNAATAATGAVGAALGVGLAERWLQAKPDAGRRLAERVRLTPSGLAFAAARVPGTYSLLSVSF